ncbi:SMC5-SMC6 complex localization factor protein 1 isoform X4 [Erinaceus europaeus]|uniref:SMC5-SMC6 complex localization factor protein 1 isoform X4 n=1 Tax=Erinaceus europaeus TaxID=9365 RepID=A0ABM3Y7W6_ERIEU|nr:SMC5-SMC6 complex localization factor protein 1 isoform X4 [Erinaceus europaeus]
MEDGAPKHVIQMTGFKMEEKEALGKLLLKLDCTFIKSEKYKNCTHLIAERLCKSEKFLAACAAGKWVLTKDYIIHSAKSGRWLDETTYEWGYKIEKDSHYSPQMQSAPKRWREELKRTGAPGAFHRWKVVLLVRANKRSDSLVRVLEAGKANVILPKSSPTGITHVIASNTRITAEQEKDNFKAPFYPIQYLGDFLLEKEIVNDEDSQANSVWHNHSSKEKNKDCWKDTELLEMKGALRETMCRTQKAMQNHPEDINVSSVLTEHHKKEKIRDSNKDLKFIKMRNVLGRHTFGIQEIKKKDEDIQRSYIVRKKCKREKERDSRKDMEHNKLKTALRKHMHIDQKEVKKSCFADHGKESKAQTIRTDMDIAEIKNALWKHIYRAQAVRYNCIRKDKQPVYNVEVFKHELAYLLTGILGAAIDYWIFLGLKTGKNVMRHMADDLGSYVSLSCDDFSSQELEIFICSFSSSWLQMFVAEAIFKKFCLQSSLGVSSEPLSLQKMVNSYLPALGKAGVHGTGKMQMPKKIGQRSCFESPRALLMLNGAKQKQVEELPELSLAKCPSLKRLKKKSEEELSCSKENCPSLVTKINIHKTNLKGETALHRACINNQVEKLILLLSLPGIDINVKDNAGWTPLHEACNYGNTVCVQEILQRCPEVDLLTQVDGVTPLHDALSNGHVEIGKLLLQCGGPVLLQQRNAKGELPLDYVISPQIKEELFALTKLEDTVENFHAQAEKHFHQQQLEFGSFLLSRMLLNFCTIFDLSSEFLLAFKGLTHLSELLMACRNYRETTGYHTDWLLDLYARNIKTLQKLPNILKDLPENLKTCPGMHTESLLVTLEMMCRSVSEFSE